MKIMHSFISQLCGCILSKLFYLLYEQKKDTMFFKSLQEKNTIFPFSITYYDHTTTDYEQDFMHAEIIN